MLDILLEPDGDLKLTENGDISLTESVRQAARVRLRWILSEWRFAPDLGFPWFEDVLVKNPNIGKIKALARNELMTIDGITNAEVYKVEFDKARRRAKFFLTLTVDGETYQEEVEGYA